MVIADALSEKSTSIDLSRFARVALCHQPTPIEFMPRLSALLDGPRVFVKRDDCTGLATGGNKARKLEFLVGEAMRLNADMLVTQGAVQSNHVRQTASAACRFGLKCHVLLERRVPGCDESYEQTGNVFLNSLFGATQEFRPVGLDMNSEAEAATQRLRGEGHRPYFIPGGGSNPTGALGYVACAKEIAEQSRELDQTFHWLVMATGSAGTQSGLVSGFHTMNVDLPVLGISVRHNWKKQVHAVNKLTQNTLDLIGTPAIDPSKIIVDDGYVGEGYGIPALSTIEAIGLAARQEGLLLDPVYSAKGFAGLIGLVRRGFFKPHHNILFLHTGGSAALFAYEEQIISHLG